MSIYYRWMNPKIDHSAARRACAPAVALLLACGCAGPVAGSFDTPEALVSAIDARIRSVETIHCLDSRLRYVGPFKGRRRSIPARLDLFIAGRDRFRAQLKHPLTGQELFTLVINGDGFLLVNLADKKALEGRVSEAMAEFLPGAETLSAQEMFLPSARPLQDEHVAMAVRRNSYILEFWRPELIPSRRLEVDARSLAPTKAEVFAPGGVTAGIARWDGFTRYDKEGIAVPREFELTLPDRGTSLALRCPALKLNSNISPKAFSLRIPPGIESQEFKPRRNGLNTPAERQ